MIPGRLLREVVKEEKMRRESWGFPAAWIARFSLLDGAAIALRLTPTRVAHCAIAHTDDLFMKDSRGLIPFVGSGLTTPRLPASA